MIAICIYYVTVLRTLKGTATGIHHLIFTLFVCDTNCKKSISLYRKIIGIPRLSKIPLTPIHVGLANLYAEVHRSDILINISYRTISDLYCHHVLKRTAGDIFFLVTDGRRICQVIRYNIQSALFIPHTGICCVQSSDHSSSSFQTNLCIINGRRVLFVRSVKYISSQSINFFTRRHVFLLKILQTYRFPLQLLSLDPRLS